MKKLPMLLAAFCTLISSCQKEGPFGFKTGQKYEYYYSGQKKWGVWEVVDVGPDWVEFDGGRRYTKEKLKENLGYFRLQ